VKKEQQSKRAEEQQKKRNLAIFCSTALPLYPSRPVPNSRLMIAQNAFCGRP
jgi:hypothetical protein